jgi:hypothetical protein
MSTIKVDSIKSSDGNTDLLTLSNGSVSGVNLGRRNLIINGAMQVAQRGTSKASITSNGYHVCDRWNYNRDIGETITMSQENDAPSGLKYSTKILVTTSDTSIGATDQNRIEQRIESQDVRHLAHGTSEAKQITVSFWVKSNKTGGYSLGLFKDGIGATASQGYTIDASGAWEYKAITFAADTVNGVSSTDNDTGLRLWFSLAAGADRTSGTANTWSTDSTHRAVGQSVNLYDATNNYWQITGVQLELGSVATPFEYRSYGEELALCQRYYHRVYKAAGGGYATGASQTARTLTTINFPVTMRADPTHTKSSNLTISGNAQTQNLYTSYAPDVNTHTVSGVSTAAGSVYWLIGSGYIEYDSEL